MPAELQLRDYQDECATAACDDVRTNEAVLLKLPTGAGKSLVEGVVLERRSTEGKALVVVHLEGLVHQLAGSFRHFFGATVVIEQGPNTELRDSNGHFDICVTSVQTFNARPEAFAGYDWATVMCDETHRALADDYGFLFKQTHAGIGGSVPLIGFTATDFRGDRRSMYERFNVLSYSKDMLWAWKENWIVPYRSKRLHKVDPVDRYLEMYAQGGTRSLAGGAPLPTIIVAGSVPRGRDLSARLRDAGIEAYMVDSLTGGDGETMDILDRYKAGDFHCLVAYRQVCEGFDAPRAKALIVDIETESPVSYVQFMGRVGRPDSLRMTPEDWSFYNSLGSTAEDRGRLFEDSIGGPQEAYIDDLVGTTEKFNFMTVARVFGADLDFEDERVDDVIGDLMELSEAYDIQTNAVATASELEQLLLDSELFEKAIEPNVDVPDNAQLVYTKHGTFWTTIFPDETRVPYVTGDGNRHTETLNSAIVVSVLQDEMGVWRVQVSRPESYYHWYYVQGKGWTTKGLLNWDPKDRPDAARMAGKGKQARPLYLHVEPWPLQVVASCQTKEQAFYRADQYVYDFFPKAYKLKYKDAHWLSDPLTAPQKKQILRMEKGGIAIPPILDKGRASQMIDSYRQGFLRPWRPNRTRRKALRKVA